MVVPPRQAEQQQWRDADTPVMWRLARVVFGLLFFLSAICERIVTLTRSLMMWRLARCCFCFLFFWQFLEMYTYQSLFFIGLWHEVKDQTLLLSLSWLLSSCEGLELDFPSGDLVEINPQFTESDVEIFQLYTLFSPAAALVSMRLLAQQWSLLTLTSDRPPGRHSRFTELL